MPLGAATEKEKILYYMHVIEMSISNTALLFNLRFTHFQPLFFTCLQEVNCSDKPMHQMITTAIQRLQNAVEPVRS